MEEGTWRGGGGLEPRIGDWGKGCNTANGEGLRKFHYKAMRPIDFGFPRKFDLVSDICCGIPRWENWQIFNSAIQM